MRIHLLKLQRIENRSSIITIEFDSRQVDNKMMNQLWKLSSFTEFLNCTHLSIRDVQIDKSIIRIAKEWKRIVQLWNCNTVEIFCNFIRNGNSIRKINWVIVQTLSIECDLTTLFCIFAFLRVISFFMRSLSFLLFLLLLFVYLILL